MTDELWITADHLRMLRAEVAAKGKEVCIPGCINWAKHNGIDFDDFIRNGAPASVFEKAGGDFALRLIAIAREEKEHGQR